MNIGGAIRKIRKDYGYSQGQFAEKVGLTQASLSNIELGRTMRPRTTHLEKISEGLGMTLGELYVHSLEKDDFTNTEKADIVLPIIKDLLHKIN